MTANNRLAITGTWQTAAKTGRDCSEQMVLVNTTTSEGSCMFRDVFAALCSRKCNEAGEHVFLQFVSDGASSRVDEDHLLCPFYLFHPFTPSPPPMNRTLRVILNVALLVGKAGRFCFSVPCMVWCLWAAPFIIIFIFYPRAVPFCSQSIAKMQYEH